MLTELADEVVESSEARIITEELGGVVKTKIAKNDQAKKRKADATRNVKSQKKSKIRQQAS